MLLKRSLQNLLIFLGLLVVSKAMAAEKLLFAVDLIRHGDRTPLQQIPKAPYVWPEGLGQLTAEGMQQEFSLGSALRKKYVDDYHLLPEHYQRETLYVRSTDSDRTLQSATAFLMGLYPLGTGPYVTATKTPALPAAYQPIPIHTVAREDEHLLAVKPSKNIFLLIPYYVASQKAWQEKTENIKDKLQRWSQLSGWKMDNRGHVDALANNLYIRELHHVPLPAGFTQQDVTEIHALAEWLVTNNFKNKVIFYPMGHTFLHTVADEMQQVVAQQTLLKYILFSGHDSSIMGVMAALGSPVDEIPHYASDLNIALFADNGQYYVEINFNNKPVNIPACGGTRCSLQKFYALAGA